ncbi:MAG: tRNA(Ile)-lysidine synthase [Methanoregula sp.]|jgi:tRNA(Ile)-lysidine synthase TilS/MesJ
MQCDKCRHEAFVFQPYSGLHLCPDHFIRDLEAKAKRTIRLHGWLRPGDHIAVVLTGSPADFALLSFLKKLTGRRRDVRISALTVDPGIGGFAVTGYAKRTADSCGSVLFTGSFAVRYGITLDEIAQREGPADACSACRVLRNDLIGEIAREHGVTRCAFAGTLDDCAGAFFSGMLKGTPEKAFVSCDTVGITRMPVISPFEEVPGVEVARYAELLPEYSPLAEEGKCVPNPCPYECSGSFEKEMSSVLETFDRKHPATKFALANLARTLAGIPGGKDRTVVCPSCKKPLENGNCYACGVRRNYRKEIGT